jgi:hypothetical protein
MKRAVFEKNTVMSLEGSFSTKPWYLIKTLLIEILCPLHHLRQKFRAYLLLKEECCRSMIFWGGSGSGSPDPSL